MAITSIGPMFFPPMIDLAASVPSFSSLLLDASAEKAAFIIRAPRTGTLDQFEFRTGSVANNPDNGIRLSFQDVDPATGDPDGTQDQYRDITGTLSGNTWQVPPGPLTSTGAGGGTKRSVTQGDLLACVIEFVSFVASDSFQVAMCNAGVMTQARNWYADLFTASWAKQTTDTPNLALKYDDGTYEQIPLIYPATAVTTNTFNSGSTPDERALRFQVPVPCRTNGAWLYIDGDGTGDVVLYDAASSVLATASAVIDPDQRNGVTAGRYYCYWPTSVDLSAATTYRLAVLPTSGTSLSTYDLSVASTAMMAAMPGGAELYGSTRVNAGAWTDATTTRPLLGLILDGFESGGGGGGGESSASYFG